MSDRGGAQAPAPAMAPAQGNGAATAAAAAAADVNYVGSNVHTNTDSNAHSATLEETNNNNVNKVPIRQQSNDEIIEEFDFSDSDLDELNDSESNGNGNGNDNDHDGHSYSSNNEKAADGDDAGGDRDGCGDVSVAGAIDTRTDNGDTHSADNTVGNGKLVAAAAEPGNQAIRPGDRNDSTSGKRKAALQNLDLTETTARTTEAEVPATLNDPFCPITPRRIVDVESECAPTSHASSTKSTNNRNSGGRVQSATTAAAGDDGGNKDAADDYYDDEPDDELIVQFLGEANCIAEARLAARRQARAEAREIRMRELERQQKEQEHNADRVFDMHTSSGMDPLARSRLATGVGTSPLGAVLNSTRGNSMSSRRSSEDSLEEEGRSLRDIRHELKDVEERFRKAMIANAQLDNERASQTYQIQLLKDKLEEMEESYAQLQREFKEKSRDCNALKRNLDKLSEELKLVQGQLSERDALIAEQGLVIVAIENDDGTDAKRALVSVENAQLLGSVQGSLDVRLKKFNEEKQQLLAEVQKLQEQLENHKSQGKGRANSMNGPSGSDEDYEAQREANKIISDYKYKLQKAEQEIASLQASLARSETQVIRYKSTAEAAEKAEAELKIERRKLQRENRETMERLEELETSNNHLLKRLDKLKNAKSALLKDL